MTDHTLYVQGKKVGTTNISVFDAEKRLVTVLDLEVALDTGSLHNRIAASTGARNINVSSSNGEVVLSGRRATRSLRLARSTCVKGLRGQGTPVINAMTVAPTQQVMLKVRFLEVDRTAGRDLGVNWFGGNKNGLGVSGLGALSNSATAGAATVTGTGSAGRVPLQPYRPGPRQRRKPQFLGRRRPLFHHGFRAPWFRSSAGSLPAPRRPSTPFGALLAQVINTHGSGSTR